MNDYQKELESLRAKIFEHIASNIQQRRRASVSQSSVSQSMPTTPISLTSLSSRSTMSSVSTSPPATPALAEPDSDEVRFAQKGERERQRQKAMSLVARDDTTPPPLYQQLTYPLTITTNLSRPGEMGELDSAVTPPQSRAASMTNLSPVQSPRSLKSMSSGRTVRQLPPIPTGPRSAI